MKKFLLTLGLVILTASGAHAQYATYDAAYMSDPGSTVQKPAQTFNWDEKPSLYLRLLPSGPPIITIALLGAEVNLGTGFGTSTRWISPSGKIYAIADTGSTGNEFWLNFSDTLWFTGSGSTPAGREAGTWTIDQIWTTVQIGSDTPTFSHDPIAFNVQAVPEPISGCLLILGGAAMAFSRRRKA